MKDKVIDCIEDEEIQQDHKFRLFSIVLYKETESYNYDESRTRPIGLLNCALSASPFT